MSAALAGALAALPGCKSVLDFQPATPAQVRAEVNAPPTEDEASRRVRFSVNDQKPFGDRYTPAMYQSGYDMFVKDLREHCIHPGDKCPLDDPSARWQLGTYKNVPDEGGILNLTLAAGILTGAIAANVVCVGENQCGNTGKTVVIVADVTVAALAVIAVVALASAFSHFRGD
jgi:hypothetical protein